MTEQNFHNSDESMVEVSDPIPGLNVDTYVNSIVNLVPDMEKIKKIIRFEDFYSQGNELFSQ